jgi:SSS family solute:Na+ symporter
MLNPTDIAVFVGFFVIVVGISIFKGRHRETGEQYFLAGRGLPWWIVGISLIAANISSEQFVGMNGGAAGNDGLAIASYDWIAAITLVIVAIWFLPRLLRCGIYTIPEYLEYRFSAPARGIMSVYMLVIYVGVTISAVLYAGGLTIHTIFDWDLTYSVYLVGAIAAIYTTYGGLKSVVWADLFQGIALILGGLLVAYLGFQAVGGIEAFRQNNADKLHMVLPGDHGHLPWTALILGIWIPNLYYWGFNQYIAQRTLAARSLKDGQLGVLMAAGIQVILPLAIVIPGIIAFQLYPEVREHPDKAFPMLIRELLGPGLRGFIFAAIAGAIISSLASMLNSASTIFTMDIYKRYLEKNPPQQRLIWTGRLITIICVVIGCSIAPHLGSFEGIFKFMQDLQGYVSPGILATFIFGFFVKRSPPAAAITGLLLCVPVYGILHLNYFENICFLDKQAITFIVVIFAMTIISLLRPLPAPVKMPVNEEFDMTSSPIVKVIGVTIVTVTVALYVVFF